MTAIPQELFSILVTLSSLTRQQRPYSRGPLGLTKREMMEAYKSSGFLVVKTGAEFRKPAYFGDEVTLESTIKFGRSSFKVDHKVTLKGEMIAEGSETRVWVVRDNYGKMKSSRFLPMFCRNSLSQR